MPSNPNHAMILLEMVFRQQKGKGIRNSAAAIAFVHPAPASSVEKKKQATKLIQTQPTKQKPKQKGHKLQEGKKAKFQKKKSPIACPCP